MTYPYAGRTDQYKASIARLKDAEILYQGKRWRGAMYLAGYALECRLKAILMEKYNTRDLQELNGALVKQGNEGAEAITHNLSTLFSFMNLSRIMAMNKNHPQQVNKNIAFTWSSAWRYAPDASDESTCNRFLEAVRAMIHLVTHSD